MNKSPVNNKEYSWATTRNGLAENLDSFNVLIHEPTKGSGHKAVQVQPIGKHGRGLNANFQLSKEDAILLAHTILQTCEVAPNKNVFVFCSGGVVNAITDENLQDIPNVAIIDYDFTDGGQCPVCDSELDIDFPKCLKCGFNWEKGGQDENARAITAYLNTYSE